MSLLSAGAVQLRDGKELALPGAIRLQAGYSLRSPAGTMTGVFAVDAPPPDLGTVRVRDRLGLLFEGSLDSKRVSWSRKGMLLTLEARSKGARLLDNEALPCVLTNVNLTALFNRFIAPRGFVCYNPNPSFTLSMYTIRKGISEWEALCGFTRRAWGITPWVEGDQVMVDRPRSAAPLVLSNTGEGLPWLTLEHEFLPYSMISQVVLRDDLGSYSTAVSNSSAPWYGVERRRYVIPSNEFTDRPSLDANQRIRRSMLDSERLTVTLPDIQRIPVGREIQVAEKDFAWYNLLVDEVDWILDASGARTRLVLVSHVYL